MRGAAAQGVRQPPHTLSLAGVTPRIASFFESAFGPNGPISRPTATDWIGALDELRVQTKQCSAEIAHYYFQGLPQCPWCPIESKLGLSLFTVQFAPRPDHPRVRSRLSLGKHPKGTATDPTLSIASGRSNCSRHCKRGLPGGGPGEEGTSRRSRNFRIARRMRCRLWARHWRYPALILFMVALSLWVRKRGQWSARKQDAQASVDKLLKLYESTRLSYQHWTDGHLFGDAFRELESNKQSLLALPQMKERATG